MAASSVTHAYGSAGSEIDFSVIGNNTTPTGTVRVILDGKTFRTVTIDSKGEGLVSLRTLAAGHHTADLIYNGDSNYGPVKMSKGAGPMAGLMDIDIPKARTATSVAVPKTVSAKKHTVIRVRVRR